MTSNAMSKPLQGSPCFGSVVVLPFCVTQYLIVRVQLSGGQPATLPDRVTKPLELAKRSLAKPIHSYSQRLKATPTWALVLLAHRKVLRSIAAIKTRLRVTVDGFKCPHQALTERTLKASVTQSAVCSIRRWTYQAHPKAPFNIKLSSDSQ